MGDCGNVVSLVPVTRLFIAKRKTTVVGQKLKLVNDLFSLLCRSATELNSLFSIPILYMITTKLLSISISIFIFISQFHHPVENLTLIAWYYMAYTLVDVIILAVIFYAADAPNRQVTALRKEIHPFLINTWKLT